jgi:ADP-ribosyl-[dinitrogen reductase] hydrolase
MSQTARTVTQMEELDRSVVEAASGGWRATCSADEAVGGHAMTSSRDKAIGALVGLAVGDAVGTTLEFERPGSFRLIDDMVGGGPFGLEPGQWTDDTSMAMCLAESILDLGDLDPADQLRRYVSWFRDGYWSANGRCFDIGGTTRHALARFEWTGAVTDADIDQESAANGSLMRLAPVPIRWHNDLGEAAERAGQSSRTTHPASRPVDACRVYAAMTAGLIQGRALDDVLDADFWQDGPLDPRVEAVIRGSWRNKQPPEIRGTGYVVNALEAALWAVAGAADFREAILRAANLGDDADTTAAIAGQLAGAHWGLSGIPVEWRERITSAERIAGIAGRLFDLGAASEEPPHPWVHDEFVHGYWVEPGSIVAGEYPGHPHSVEEARSKVNLLVDHGIRTFVDLTTPHDNMAPYEHLIVEAADRRRLDLQRIQHPIPDMKALEANAYDEILATICSRTENGGVYIHCWGGVGRTGTVVGCLLVDGGLSADAALARLDELRSGTKKRHMPAPQTREQIEIIHQRSRTD